MPDVDDTYDGRIKNAQRVRCSKRGREYDRQAKTPAPVPYICQVCR